LPRRPVPARPAPAPDRHAAIAPLSIQVADDLGAQLRSLALTEGQSPEALGSTCWRVPWNKRFAGRAPNAHWRA